MEPRLYIAIQLCCLVALCATVG